MHHEYPEQNKEREQENQTSYTTHICNNMCCFTNLKPSIRDEPRQKYLQMGQGYQVVERTFRNTGNIISVERPGRGEKQEGIKPQYSVCSPQVKQLVLKKDI